MADIPGRREHSLTDGFPNAGGAGFRNNCQNCVVAVDNQLAGASTGAVGRVFARHDLFAGPAWRQRTADAVGTTNSFRPTTGYGDIHTELQHAGDGRAGPCTGCAPVPAGCRWPGTCSLS